MDVDHNGRTSGKWEYQTARQPDGWVKQPIANDQSEIANRRFLNWQALEGARRFGVGDRWPRRGGGHHLRLHGKHGVFLQGDAAGENIRHECRPTISVGNGYPRGSKHL